MATSQDRNPGEKEKPIYAAPFAPLGANKQRPPRSKGGTKSRQDQSALRKVLLKKDIELRLRFESKILEWQEALSEPGVEMELLAEGGKYLQPGLYQEIVEERNVNDLCGYPLCSDPPRHIKTIGEHYVISKEKRKILDVRELKSYCSSRCLAASRFFKMQLTEDPVYIRAFDKLPPVEVVPLNVDINASKDMFKQHSIPLGQDLFQDFVQGLLKTLPSANIDITIHEKPTDSQPIAPKPTTYKEQAYNAVEGYQVHIPQESQKASKGSRREEAKEKTELERKMLEDREIDTGNQEEVVADAFEKMYFLIRMGESDSSPEDSRGNIDGQRESQTGRENKDRRVNKNTAKRERGMLNPTSSATLSTISPSQRKPSSKPLMIMSVFARIWMMLDRIITQHTRVFISCISSGTETGAKIKASEQANLEIKYRQSARFSENIMTAYSTSIRAQLGISARVENDLIQLMQTLNLSSETANPNPTDSALLCLIFLRALSTAIPLLNSQLGGQQGNYTRFREVISRFGITMDHMDQYLKYFTSA
ncbi:uncharacterized protein VTP21DRAFT_9614 [Calcarisporiella thermophila]|uniref:uncharacterized protein n=1 Tax=Calcarisporiella thermophila TaxID=911321 RepID=UPI003743F6B8